MSIGSGSARRGRLLAPRNAPRRQVARSPQVALPAGRRPGRGRCTCTWQRLSVRFLRTGIPLRRLHRLHCFMTAISETCRVRRHEIANMYVEGAGDSGARCAQQALFAVAAGASRRSRGEAAHARLRRGLCGVTIDDSTRGRNVKAGAVEGSGSGVKLTHYRAEVSSATRQHSTWPILRSRATTWGTLRRGPARATGPRPAAARTASSPPLRRCCLARP